MSAKVQIGSTYYRKGFFNQTKEMSWLPCNNDYSNISIIIQCIGPNSEVTVSAEIRYKGMNGQGNWINSSHKGRIFAKPKRPLITWFKENISEGDILSFFKNDENNYSLALESSSNPPTVTKPEIESEPETDEWDKTDDWFWEGNIQNTIVEYLQSIGFSEIKTVDTKSKEQGPDITAIKDGKRWVIEVKGYPSDKYTEDRGNKKKGELKSTTPPTQARHWFSEALMSVLIAKSENPSSEIGLVFPNFKTYLSNLKRISYVRGKLDIHVFIVEKNGKIAQYHPYQHISL